MDMKNTEWFGQLTVSGVGEPINLAGSVMSILNQLIPHLRDAKPRTLTEGKSITIRFSDKPFTAKVKQTLEELTRETEAGIDWGDQDHQGPRPDESYSDFMTRLVAEGQPPHVAQYLADDWFDLPKDVQTQRWMADPRIQRFNELQVSKVAFESATPEEYALLKQYVLKEYPERAQLITFRTA
jgi:hypothetical protein